MTKVISKNGLILAAFALIVTAIVTLTQQLTKDAMKDTEKQLHMKCPLDNEWKVGRTWAQTH